MMRRFIHVLVGVICAVAGPMYSKHQAKKIAIIKADDIRGVSEKWDAFFALSKEKGVKVSAGIICHSLENDTKGYYDWLKRYQGTGDVEFWNHGWDHKRWETENGEKQSEFGGSGYEHQKKHFEDSQKIMIKVLGSVPIAFGPPYNAFDADTDRVVSENSDTRIIFSYSRKPKAGKLIATMRFKGELDGTGKPNFEMFKAEYKKKKKGVSFTALQFHPPYFKEGGLEEYGKIIDFLLEEGWTFVLPSEYVAMVN